MPVRAVGHTNGDNRGRFSVLKPVSSLCTHLTGHILRTKHLSLTQWCELDSRMGHVILDHTYITLAWLLYKFETQISTRKKSVSD